MAHEVVSLFSVRVAPWHLGIAGGTTEKETHVLAEYPGREEAMKLAGHDFTVVEGSLRDEVEVDGRQTYPKIEGWKVLKNSKTNEILHVSRDSYVVVQPEVLYDLTEAILGEKDVKWETAGVLKGGAVLWTLAKVDKPFTVTGDDSPIYPYVAASTTNDGSGCTKVSNINTRIVCWNTWNAAESESDSSGREFTFRHTKNIQSRIEAAKQILAGATVEAQAFRDLGEELVKVVFTDAAIEKFISEFIPSPPEALISDRVKTNIAEARGKVKGLFDGKTVNAEIRNTAYGALQVGVEYLDHLRGYRNEGTYLNRTLLKTEPAKAKLVPLIQRIAAENPLVKV